MYSNIASDAAAIEAVKKGDCEAFAPLIDRYKLHIYRLVYRMVGNRDDAEDLVQEVFIKAYVGIKGFKSGRPFLPWISRIAMNHAINFRKKEQREKTMPLEWIEDRQSDGKDDPVEMTRDKLLKERVSTAMAQLPDEYRAILVLRVEEERSYTEISEILSIPKGTVMSRLARARRRLKEIFMTIGVPSGV